jgi:hypothetical protein
MTMFLVMLALLVGGAAVVGVLMLVFGVMLAVTVGMAVALVVKLAPILLLVWLAVRIFGRRGRRRTRSISAADRAWLEGS